MIRKKRAKGVTLFECLVYITLFSFLATTGMFIVSQLWQSGLANAAFERSSLAVHSAFDVLTHDIQCAPSLREQWKCITSTTLIWPIAPDKDCGWIFQKGKLMRLEGVYHPSTAQWSNKSSSLIAPLSKASFVCQGTPRISHVTVYLTDTTTTLKRNIFLHNRTTHA